MSRRYNQLPRVAFCILLALSLRPRHGYEIMKQIKEDSDGRISLVPGALYASLKQLREQDLVEETDNAADKRRRYYRLTDKGHDHLNAELSYYEVSLQLAKQRNVFEAIQGGSL